MQGKTIKCPSCGGEIRVPTAEQFEAAMKAAADSASASPTATTAAKPAANVSGASQPTRTARASSPTSGSPALSAEALEKELAGSVTSFRRPKQPTTDDMDMTPMVDVTFLLLIFFMITASFAVQKSIQRPTQKTDAPSTAVQQIEDDKDSLIIQVDEFNAYNIIISGSDTSASSKQDLIVKLKDYQGATNAGERAVKLVVDAHENCIHSAVVDALDAGREAGFENFEVRTVEQFD
jgi:biopolymer transport protein ExbD